jgi:hypothetical protein
MAKNKVVWAPQEGPQHALVECPVREVLFGGARGGGKTDGVLGKWAVKAQQYRINAVFFRKEMPQTDDLIKRAKEIYCPLGANYREQQKEFTFPNGACIRFRPLENVADAEKYQGQNLTDVCVEEAGNYSSSDPIDRLWGVLRSADGVPVQMILTANPGGSGQQWIKKRFIDPAPRGMKVLKATLPDGSEHQRVYIPSRVQDNKLLLARDPQYVARLYLVGSKELVDAWLTGNWDAIEGAFFDTWSPRNIVRPFEIPREWARFRSFDWGFARPFSVGWWAVASDDRKADGITIPRGAMIRYREWYGCLPGQPNTGLRMTAEQVGAGIIERERNDGVMMGVADPAIFSSDSGPSIAERMASVKCHWRAADNTRVAKSGAMAGWDQMRARIGGDERGPMLVVFSTCLDAVRLIPSMQHDRDRPEDLDTDSEDHLADEVRYACSSRPWIKTTPVAPNAPNDSYARTARRMQQGSGSWKTV